MVIKFYWRRRSSIIHKMATNRLKYRIWSESKLSVGAFNYYTSYCNDCYTSYRKGDYASITSSENNHGQDT